MTDEEKIAILTSIIKKQRDVIEMVYKGKTNWFTCLDKMKEVLAGKLPDWINDNE